MLGIVLFVYILMLIENLYFMMTEWCNKIFLVVKDRIYYKLKKDIY